jgi:hypothetical protein
MSRRLLWSVASLAVCLGLATAWFSSTFERVSVSRRDAPQAEARQNPYLALERFFATIGRPITRTTGADLLHRLPVPGVLILDRGRAYHLTGARQTDLLRWVDAGGYLILVPEVGDAPDPLADAFGLAWTDSLREPATGAGERQPPRPRLPPRPAELAVSVPGSARPLVVAFREGLTAVGQAPVWAAEDPNYGALVLHFSRGQGRVTVVAHLDALVSNVNIGDRDHAELVSTLVERYQPSGTLVLLTPQGTPTLGEWLMAHAPLLLASLAALLGVWLWNVVPRFGSIVPEPAPERRELHEHLLAVGRFVRKRGGDAAWLPVVRSAVEGALVRRHPSYRLGSGETPDTLAMRTGIPAADLILAFTGDGARADRFVATMRALQRVERSL